MRNAISSIILILITGLFVAGQSRRVQRVRAPTAKPVTKTSEARTLLRQAKAAGLKINIKEYFKRRLVLDQIGEAQARAGDLSGAVDTVNRADPYTSATIDAIRAQLGNTNDLAMAKSLGRRLKQGGISFLISNMARSQAKKGNIDEALRTAAQIQILASRSYALEEIALVQAAKGDHPGARRTFALARAAHQTGLVKADDFEMVVVLSLLSSGDEHTARKTIDSWKSTEIRFAGMISGAGELFQKGNKASADLWLRDALEKLPAGKNYEFLRYVAIPVQVKLGQMEDAMKAAAVLAPEMRLKGYNAVAVTCAEAKDVACVNGALEKMQTAVSDGDGTGLSQFAMQLMNLNVTAALIDNGEFEVASRLLTTAEQNMDDVSKASSFEPSTQLQRVSVLAQQGRFDDARALALKIRIDSVDEVHRGTALRITALLQTRKNGVASTRPWASALADNEGRAYALLGIAQALIEIDNVKLGYSAIHIH